MKRIGTSIPINPSALLLQVVKNIMLRLILVICGCLTILNCVPLALAVVSPFAEIDAKYTTLGGNKGFLGTPTSGHSIAADRTGWYRHYQRGSIFWSPTTGAYEVHGDIRGKWAGLGWERSFLGYPTSDETPVPDNIGRYSHFQHGFIYWSPQTGAHVILTAMRDKWGSLGWGRSHLGYPTTDDSRTADGVGRYMHFQGGSIFWSPETGAREVHGGIRDRWASLGWERSSLGYPLSDETPVPDGIGRYSRFQRGFIYWSSATGARLMSGPVHDKWASSGWGRSIGYPVNDLSATSDGRGRYNHFQRGSIFWSPTTNAQIVLGAICDKWASLGWERGSLGYPMSDEAPVPDGIGRYSHFQGGSLYWSPATGAHVILGTMRDKWGSLGWGRSHLGYPTTDDSRTADGIGRYLHFQGGSIFWSPSTGAREVHGAIKDRWASLGWERSSLGYPISDEISVPGFLGYGQVSKFQRGAIYYTPDAGVVVVPDLAGEIITRKLNPSLGRRRLLAILWHPHDNSYTPSVEDVDRTLFGDNPSIRDYYRENSGGKFMIERAGVLGWYSADKPGNHYWGEDAAKDPHDLDGDGFLSGHVEKWTEAIRKADREFDFAAYDINRDKVLTADELGIIIVIPGQDRPYGVVRTPLGREFPQPEPLVVDGVRITAIVEWWTGNPLHLGTPIHELSHLYMGTPDRYHDDAHPSYPFRAGVYSIMDNGYTSAHHEPFIKLKAGWLNYNAAIGTGEYLLKDIETTGEALVLYDHRRGPGEYFIIENRWRGTSYDAGRAGTYNGGLPGDGILIWHIIEDHCLWDKITPHPDIPPDDWRHRAVLLLRANGGRPFDDSRALFNKPGNIISDDTSPAHLRWIDGSRSGFEVRLLSGAGSEVRLAITHNR